MKPKPMHIIIDTAIARMLTNQLRRVLPSDHDTDMWTAQFVEWLEHEIEAKEKQNG